jgi:hypothetical protein
VGSLDHWRQSFNDVGWFIPPFIKMGALSKAASEINTRKGNYNQDDLEKTLALFYEPIGLAAMAMYRYPIAPVITDYCQTVAEAVEAHFLGLDHVAVGGLIYLFKLIKLLK